MKPDILIKVDAPVFRADLGRDFAIHDFDLKREIPGADILKRARILITSGSAGCTREEMDALPSLGLICCVGTGFEKVDLDAARGRGVVVTHGAGVNAAAVADHAFALLLSIVRNIPAYHASAVAGEWRGAMKTRPMLGGKKIGIVGMGGIGTRVARRAEGFEMEVSYLATKPKPELPWTFKSTAVELASGADFLVVAAPGGAGTFHMIDAAALKALGPQGFLVNVGRGSVVDTKALIEALASGGIAGAALDVFEGEPDIPAELRSLPNVVLTPHVGGAAPEVQSLGAQLMRKNIELFLGGKPVATPVPQPPAN
ncbi:NAD(P)-dependent oxidoreductase [Terrarubrum flagellatum]|uniref:NAD(P)-dependent oxidoreductase n=1 Tax=Terrirubrum flagellatum TaxID=2895980 RepID=UPI003144D9FE